MPDKSPQDLSPKDRELIGGRFTAEKKGLGFLQFQDEKDLRNLSEAGRPVKVVTEGSQSQSN